MSGDISAINSWARSYATRANALALNTGINGTDARNILVARDAGRKASGTRSLEVIARHNKSRTGK